jgi:RHS repeat-associated protein
LNRFQPTPEDRGQPTSFDPGTVEVLFTVPFEEAELTWQLDGNGATVSAKSPRCEGPTPTPTPTPEPVTTITTIDYEYDPLYRLVQANYSSGEFFYYAYDAVGNRLTQTTHLETNSYTYDAANRLTSVDGVTYSWDEKGNLLNDGTRTFTYNHANRLTSVVINGDSFTYAYNGLGDRLEQKRNGALENYLLDLAAGLTQVLSSNDINYLYGVGRIGQVSDGGNQYHLGDALASVRHVTGNGSALRFAQSYEPFGSPNQAAGQNPTAYGYTGEWTDNTGLVHLRARDYQPSLGRFQTKDTYIGTAFAPASQNRYIYAHNNPVRYSDPSGRCVLTGVDTVLCLLALAVGIPVIAGVGTAGWDYFVTQGGGLGGFNQGNRDCIDMYQVWQAGKGGFFGALTKEAEVLASIPLSLTYLYAAIVYKETPAEVNTNILRSFGLDDEYRSAYQNPYFFAGYQGGNAGIKYISLASFVKGILSFKVQVSPPSPRLQVGPGGEAAIQQVLSIGGIEVVGSAGALESIAIGGYTFFTSGIGEGDFPNNISQEEIDE